MGLPRPFSPAIDYYRSQLILTAIVISHRVASTAHNRELSTL